MINQEIKVGEPKKIEERVLYPILKIFHWKHHQSESFSVFPIALVVVEGDLRYLYPFEEIENPEELMEMV